MNEVEEIKSKIDIVDLISGYLTLKKTGANYKALCPFHSEKTPSFMVSPERQSFKCFGCGKGGDIFTFIEEIEGMDFYDALKLLANRAGVELKTKRTFSYGGKEFAPTEKSKLFDINDLAAKVYHKILITHPKAERARRYLKNRGISKETIESFKLGYAPRSWDFLIRFLAKHGYSEKEIFKAGLLVLGDKGQYWDRFRGRIMFPINNISGQVIAFTGRVLEEDEKSAKYVNSAESAIYIKGKTIYGLDKARIDIRAQNAAILVEGNMDVIACHQAGFHNVVAVSGTALTPEQLKIIARYSSNIIFSFDNDNAGKIALKRAITLALQNDISPKVLLLPGYKDPDEAIKADPKNWERAVKNAKPGLEQWIDELVLANDINDVSQKKMISKEILPVIKIIANELEKEHYIKYLAKRLAVSESSILAEINKTKKAPIEPKDENLGGVDEQEKISLEKRIAGLVWQERKLIDKIPASFLNQSFSDQAVKELFTAIQTNKKVEKMSADQKSQLDLYALEATRDLDPEDPDIIEQEFFDLLKHYQNQARERLKSDIANQIAAAQAKGDTALIKQLMIKLQSAILEEDKNKENR